MATGIAPPKPPSDVPPRTEYDRFIEDRLEKTQRQVKTVDLFTRLAGLAVAVLLYLIVAAVLDHWVVRDGLGFFGRFLLWLGLIGGGGYYFFRHIVPLVVSRINPVFAAYTLEQSRPTFKNSLINFLFLRRHREEIEKDELAKRVYRGLEHRTAAELTQVSVEAAVDRTPLLYLSYALAGLVTVCCLYLLISPKNPITSFERVIWPWAKVGVPTRVSIDAIEPGNTAAYQGETVAVSAEIHGLKEGEPVRLVYSTADGQSVDQVIPMTVPEGGYRYRCEVPPGSLGLQQNIDYYLAAGDCVSQPFKIEMQIPLSIVVDRVDYKYPEYTGLAPRTVEKQGDLRAIEGTRVTIHAIANQPIAQALIEFDGEARDTLRMDAHGKEALVQFTLRMNPDDPTQFEHKFYHLRFTDPERRANLRPIRHAIEVIPDLKPTVSFVAPTEDTVQVPLAGSLELKVRAEDPDFGLRRVLLHAERDGRGMAIKPLLNQAKPDKALQGLVERSFRFEPAKLGLKTGDKVVYWAEAQDNKEDAKGPSPNVAKTENRTIVIGSDDPQKQQPKPGEGQGAKPPQDNAKPDGQAQNANDPNRDPQNGQNEQPRPGENRQNGNEQPKETMNRQPENQEPGKQGNENSKDNQGQDSPKGTASEGGDQNRNQGNQQGQGAENPGNAAAGENQPNNEKPGENSDQRPNQGPNQGNDQGNKEGTQESGAGNSSGGKNSRSESQADGQQDPNSAGQEKQPVDGGLNPGDAIERILEHANKQEQQGGQGQDGSQKQSTQPQQPGANEGAGQQQTPGAEQNNKGSEQNNPGQPKSAQQNGNQDMGNKPRENGNQPSDANQSGNQNQRDPQNEGLQNQGDKPGANERSGQRDNQKSQKGRKPEKGMNGQSGAGEENASGNEDQQTGDKQSGDKGSSGKSQPRGPKGSQNTASKPGESGNENPAPGENPAEGNQPGMQNQPGNNQPGNNQPGNNQPGNNQPGNNQPGNQSQPGDQNPAAEGQQQQPGSQGGREAKGSPESKTAKPQRTPDNQQAGSEPNASQQRPEAGEGAQANGQTQGQQEKPEGQPSDPNTKGGNPQPNAENSGAGMTPDKPNATPSSEQPNQRRDINPGGKDPTNPQKGDEGSSPAQKPQPSKTKGDTEGDREGGGGQGAGQPSEQQGTGKPGSNTESEQGGSKATAQGKGETGNNAGNQAQSDKPTGQPGSKGPGQGSSGQNQPGGENPENSKTGQPNAGAKPGTAGGQQNSGTNQQQGNPSNQPQGGQPMGKSDGPQTGTVPGNPNQGGRPGSEQAPEKPAQEPQNLSADDPNLDYARKQTSLALRTLEEELAKDKPELLERLGWKKADAQKFLQQWQQMMRDAKEQGPRGEAAKKELQNALRSLGLRQHGTKLEGVKTQADALRQQDAGQFRPPPGWEEHMRAYNKGGAGSRE